MINYIPGVRMVQDAVLEFSSVISHVSTSMEWYLCVSTVWFGATVQEDDRRRGDRKSHMTVVQPCHVLPGSSSCQPGERAAGRFIPGRSIEGVSTTALFSGTESPSMMY